jgi:hypothetical protein
MIMTIPHQAGGYMIAPIKFKLLITQNTWIAMGRILALLLVIVGWPAAQVRGQEINLDVLLLMDYSNSQIIDAAPAEKELQFQAASLLVESLTNEVTQKQRQHRLGIVNFGLNVVEKFSLQALPNNIFEQSLRDQSIPGSDFRPPLDAAIEDFKANSYGTGNKKVVILFTDGHPQLDGNGPMTQDEIKAYFSKQADQYFLDGKGNLLDRIHTLQAEGVEIIVAGIGKNAETDQMSWENLGVSYLLLKDSHDEEPFIKRILGSMVPVPTTTATLPPPTSTSTATPTRTPSSTSTPTPTVTPTLPLTPTDIPATVITSTNVLTSAINTVTPTPASPGTLGFLIPNWGWWVIAVVGGGGGIILKQILDENTKSNEKELDELLSKGDLDENKSKKLKGMLDKFIPVGQKGYIKRRDQLADRILNSIKNKDKSGLADSIYCNNHHETSLQREAFVLAVLQEATESGNLHYLYTHPNIFNWTTAMSVAIEKLKEKYNETERPKLKAWEALLKLAECQLGTSLGEVSILLNDLNNVLKICRSSGESDFSTAYDIYTYMYKNIQQDDPPKRVQKPADSPLLSLSKAVEHIAKIMEPVFDESKNSSEKAKALNEQKDELKSQYSAGCISKIEYLILEKLIDKHTG